MDKILVFTAYTCAALAAVGLLVAAFISAGAYLKPRLSQMEKGLKPVKGDLSCCPAGLGCNDIPQTKCLRQEARRIATAEELIDIDTAWSNFQGAKGHRKIKAKDDYHKQRNAIVQRAIMNAAEMMNDMRENYLPELGAGEPSTTSSGNVVEDKKGKKSSRLDTSLSGGDVYEA